MDKVMSDEEKKDLKTDNREASIEDRRPAWRPQDADREYFRYETKKRIQQYSVPPQTIFRPAKHSLRPSKYALSVLANRLLPNRLGRARK